MSCACCGTEMTDEQVDTHRLINAIHDALACAAKSITNERGTDGMDACLAQEALLSVIATVIDHTYKGERRTNELQKCEAFFRAEYAN